MIINSDQSLKDAIEELTKQYKENKYLNVTVTKGMQRTLTQNAALHKYFELLADSLNDAGYTIAKVLTKPLDISWSKHTVKELLWRPVQNAILDKKTTTRLKRFEVTQVYDELNNIMSTRYGLSVGFPDAHSQQSAKRVRRGV